MLINLHPEHTNLTHHVDPPHINMWAPEIPRGRLFVNSLHIIQTLRNIFPPKRQGNTDWNVLRLANPWLFKAIHKRFGRQYF